jgi:hypothetical protein
MNVAVFRIHNFDGRKLKKFTSENFFISKLQFTYPLASTKDFQATEGAFSPQKNKKKHPALQNKKFLNFYLL